jgi:hypothetical protein
MAALAEDPGGATPTAPEDREEGTTAFPTEFLEDLHASSCCSLYALEATVLVLALTIGGEYCSLMKCQHQLRVL